MCHLVINPTLTSLGPYSRTNTETLCLTPETVSPTSFPQWLHIGSVLIHNNSFRSILSRNEVGISHEDKDFNSIKQPDTHLQLKCCLCAVGSVGDTADRIRNPSGAKKDQWASWIHFSSKMLPKTTAPAQTREREERKRWISCFGGVPA